MKKKVQLADNVSVSQELVVSNITGINLIMPVHISNLSGVVKDQNTQNPIAGALITT